jgi:hypothetical protein
MRRPRPGDLDEEMSIPPRLKQQRTVEISRVYTESGAVQL